MATVGCQTWAKVVDPGIFAMSANARGKKFDLVIHDMSAGVDVGEVFNDKKHGNVTVFFLSILTWCLRKTGCPRRFLSDLIFEAFLSAARLCLGCAPLFYARPLFYLANDD